MCSLDFCQGVFADLASSIDEHQVQNSESKSKAAKINVLNLVSLPLGRIGPQDILITREHHLKEVRVIQSPLHSTIEEFNEMATCLFGHIFEPGVSIE